MSYAETIPGGHHNAGGKSKPSWNKASVIEAKFSECDRYRYTLIERWDKYGDSVMFLLMNPSVANLDYADPTLIKTGNYARKWGFGCQMIANVHAYRITDSRLLMKQEDPQGPDNEKYIMWMALQCHSIVLAYGKPHGSFELAKLAAARARTLVKKLQDMDCCKLSYLEMCDDGITPKHPLYLKGDLHPTPYTMRL